MSRPRTIVDADYQVVRGPYRPGEEHRAERGWYFTGRYNADGDALFMRHPRWWRRRAFVRRWYPLIVVVVILGGGPLLIGALAWLAYAVMLALGALGG